MATRTGRPSHSAGHSGVRGSAAPRPSIDDRLIKRYVDLDTDRYAAGRADARLRDSGVSVWAIVGHLRAIGDDIDQAARDYHLPRQAIEAALAYYRQNRELIDARLLMNKV